MLQCLRFITRTNLVYLLAYLTKKSVTNHDNCFYKQNIKVGGLADTGYLSDICKPVTDEV